MNKKITMDKKIITSSIIGGILIGLALTFIGLSGAVNFVLWLILYSVWIYFALKSKITSKLWIFLSIIAAALLSGFFTAVLGVIFLDTLLENVKELKMKEYFSTTPPLKTIFLGVTFNTIAGVVVGLIALGLLELKSTLSKKQ